MTATDTTWQSSSFADHDDIEYKTGEWDGIMVDATSGKFAYNAASGYIQVRAPLAMYVPLAASENSATLTLGMYEDYTADFDITVDGTTLLDNGYSTTLDAGDEARWVKVEFAATGSEQSVYLGSVTVDYAEDTATYPGTPTDVTAEDTTWDLTTGDDSIDTEGNRNDWHGIRIDASASGAKFSSNGGSARVQVKANTVIYIPVAASDEGAILRLSGTDSADMAVTVDGETADLNTDVIVDTDETRYVTVAFGNVEGASGAEIYLTGISVDYIADDEQTYHMVEVGPDGDYQTITEALANETSSLKDRLVLNIEPGDYEEKITVTQPGVVFQNADESYENKVVIHESYYSSNVWDKEGNYVQQDDYDLGTSECGTVIIAATATGFSAYGITFQNDYNVVDHLGDDDETPAVAFDSKADKVNLKDCTFIGRQDTLYVEGSGNRVYVNDSYIEGTVDFIFGDADAYFTDCDIHMAAFGSRTSGYYTAPNTKKGNVGLVFHDCTLTADDQLTEVSLGRPWQTLCAYDKEIIDEDGVSRYTNIDCEVKNENYSDVSSAATFIGGTMPDQDQMVGSRWSLWRHRDESYQMVNVTYTDDVRFTEMFTTNPDGTLVTAKQMTDDIGFGAIDNDTYADSEAAAAAMLSAMKIGVDYNWDAAGMNRYSTNDGTEEPDDGTSSGGHDTGAEGSDDGTGGSGANVGGSDEATDGTTESGDGGSTDGARNSVASGEQESESTLSRTGSAVLAMVVVVASLLVAGTAMLAVRGRMRRH